MIIIMVCACVCVCVSEQDGGFREWQIRDSYCSEHIQRSRHESSVRTYVHTYVRTSFVRASVTRLSIRVTRPFHLSTAELLSFYCDCFAPVRLRSRPIVMNVCSVCLSVASRSQRVSLIVILFVCLDVCRSFRDLQPTTIDRSQPNLVGRYIPVLRPV